MFTFKRKHINNKKKFLENISVIFQFAIIRLRLYLHLSFLSYYTKILLLYKKQKTKNKKISEYRQNVRIIQKKLI